MSLSVVRKSGRLKARKRSRHMLGDFEYDENKFDPDDESNMEIQSKSDMDVSSNISHLLQSHSREANIHKEITPLDQDLTVAADSQVLSCGVCGKISTDILSYDRHMKSHSSDRRFHCGQCTKTFMDSCSLKRHMKTHEDDRPFSCEICQKTFRDTGSISRHMLTHTERPRTFQCSMCDKSFTDKCGLKRHERTHTGVRPFVCEVCQKAFMDSCSFKRHQKIHIGIKNFHCPTCNRSFMEKQSLVRHQKNVCKFPNEMYDSGSKSDKAFNGPSLSDPSTVSDNVDFQISEESKEFSDQFAFNNHSLSEPISMTPLSADVVNHSSEQLVNTKITKQTKSYGKGQQPSLGSLIQKDPGLYDSISEIVESIDSYEKMLDLCGDQGQKEIDAALMRDPFPLPDNLLCFECGELLVDGRNFKSEGKLFHPTMTNAFKCLVCEAIEDEDDDQYGDPPVLMPHYDVKMEDKAVEVQGYPTPGAFGMDNTLQVSERDKESEIVCSTSDPVDPFQKRIKKQHGVHFVSDSGDCLKGGEMFISQDGKYYMNSDEEQPNIGTVSVPIDSKSKSKHKKTRAVNNNKNVASEKEPQNITCASSTSAETKLLEGLSESEDQPRLDYETDDATIPSVFPCHLCTKVFASASFLAQHLSLHRRSPHKCQVCTKSFTSGPALKRHMRLHTGEKPYICPFCRKQFRDPSNFNKHKKNCFDTSNKDYSYSSIPNLSTDCLPYLDFNGSYSAENEGPFHSVADGDGSIPVERKTVNVNADSVGDGDRKENDEIEPNDDSTRVDEEEIDVVSAATLDCDRNDTGIGEERFPVMSVVPLLDDEDFADSQSPVDDEIGLENNTQNSITIGDVNKAFVDESDKKQKEYIVCEVCQKLCENQDHLDMHMNYHTGNPNITCIECGKTFADSFGMKRHLRIHLGIRPFTCEYCGRGYCDNWSLKKHKSKGCVKSEVKVPIHLLHPCTKCVKVFCDEEYLMAHMKMHKGLVPMKYQCDVCHKCFSEAFNLKKHRRLHMAICPGCGQEFSNIKLLTSHQESECKAAVPAKEDTKSFTCDICGRAYSTRSYLERHRKIHSDVKPHVCEICNKRFAEAFKLRRHKKACHSDEKPFICQDCGKCFSDKGALKRHAVSSSCALRKVIGEPVSSETCACQFCDKVFPKNYMLVRHMTVHSQNRPFACELCGRSYKDTSSLKRHQMIHQGVKNFICPNCGADFYYSDSLKRHMSGRCGKGKKTKIRRRKAVSWTRPRKRYSKKAIQSNDIVSNNNHNESSDRHAGSVEHVNVMNDDSVVQNIMDKKLHTLRYIPTVIPEISSTSFRIPPSGISLVKEGKWSCHFQGHCWQCDGRVDSASALMAHRRQVHRGRKRFSCPKCFFRLHRKIYWRAHASSCHFDVNSLNVGSRGKAENVRTRKRIQAASMKDNNTDPAAEVDVGGKLKDEMTSENVREGRRPRRSVPRAKWSWISQI